MSPALLLPALLLAVPMRSHAQSSNNFYSLPVDAAADAMSLMLGNPPLPRLYLSEKSFKVEPYYFSGTVNSAGAATYGTQGTGSFRGAGGAGSWSVGEGRWGLYVLAAGSALGGSFNSIQSSERISSSDGSFELLSADVTRRFFGSKPGGFVLPVFAGPVVEDVGFSAAVQNCSSPSGNDIGSCDVSGHSMRVGFLGGIEAGIPAGRGWILNPFAIGGGAGPRTINVSVTPSDAFPSETNLFDSVFLNAGLNVAYLPWGLSANLTSFLLGDLLTRSIQASDNPLAGFRTEIFTVSWSFGGSSPGRASRAG